MANKKENRKRDRTAFIRDDGEAQPLVAAMESNVLKGKGDGKARK